MAEQNRNGVQVYFPEFGIPTELNRIKTPRILSRERVSSGAEDLDQYNESPCAGASISRSFRKQKPKVVHKGLVKFFQPKEGFRKGRKIARWFTSSLFKDSDQTLGDFPKTKFTSAYNMPDKDMARRKFHKGQKKFSRKEFLLGNTSTERVPKGFKKISHELGPTGGIHPVNPRAHSFNDLKTYINFNVFCSDVLLCAYQDNQRSSWDHFTQDLMWQNKSWALSWDVFCEKCRIFHKNLIL